MYFVDIHSHIAWDIDDGIPSQPEAEKALDMAYADQIRIILSTPHVTPGETDALELQSIRKRQEELKQLARKKDILIRKGAETMINSSFMQSLLNNQVPKIEGTDYTLVEYNVRMDYHAQQFSFDPLYELKVRGYKPVIAHVERYFYDGLDYEVIDEWKENGYIFQVNATSLLGKDNPQFKTNAWELLKKGYAHAVATDTHRTTGPRIENLSAVEKEIEKVLGEKAASLLLYENPLAILKGEAVEDLPEMKKSGFRLFKKNK